MPITVDEAKSAARSLRKSLAESGAARLTHAQALEAVARTVGFRDWNSCSAALLGPRPLAAVPVLRVYDEAAARQFYCDYLGFAVDFEHRFAPDLPLYLRVARGGVQLDLSQHHGDGTPGTVVWLPTVDIAAFHRELRRRDHLTTMRPGIDRSAPGGPTVELLDPFDNALRFCEPDG
ncbi:bleomycin resistance family protein [Rhodococcus kroppenstedtii]|uniref:Bleomycin resistance protein n=1 Tax=Rhodococcoides kroppenstedtii TaxID=293050 RepID=A0ABS7NNL3_9NOCA|nr:bleomycin resistance family protein [Rhodococcus kroppenstedtii]MBY6319603.1 bleomycin resistance family protein [Rhodococcus kroppenstedtii]MBY6398286.1 bleomycin resistance family protein [Rhodococcus kroppenstedtii]MBY6438611.1 bleomycin resistance family protein [Rhodococcus kroppenstedtii]